MELSQRFRLVVVAALAVAPPALLPVGLGAETAGRITGVSGLFIRSKDPKALAAWRRDVLGVAIEP